MNKTYTVTAADEPGGILGTAITEDTTEETAGETNDEHDDEECMHAKSNDCIHTPEVKIPSLDPHKTTKVDFVSPEKAEGDVDIPVGPPSETKGEPFAPYEWPDHGNHYPEASETNMCCTPKAKATADLLSLAEEEKKQTPPRSHIASTVKGSPRPEHGSSTK